MDWHYSVFWIVLIFKLTCGEYCLRTLDTVRDVSSCPLNIEEWEAAAKRIDCNRIKMTRNCEDAVYHCLRDAVKKTMVEVCTVPKNLNGFCPYFYRDPPYVRNDYDRDCSKSSMCPNFYSSKDSYNYSVCYNDTSILAAVSTSEPTSSTVLNPTRIITVQIISAGGTADTKEENDETWMKIFFPIVSLMMLIIAYIIALCLVKKSESDISWKQAFWSVNQQILRIACCKCFRKDDNGVTSANPEKCEDSVHLPLLEDSDHLGNNESNVNTNPPDRIPVQDPQTPESTTPDKSNSSKNGIFQMSPTQGVITDTTDSTNAVPKDSVSSSETKIPVKQDGNDPETCNRPSSSEPFSESSAKTSVNTNPPDRIPVQDPQTPESTTPDESNSSKNGISLMKSTQGTMTDTTDSTSAVTGNSGLSSETNTPVKQDGNDAETCNKPSSSDPLARNNAERTGNTNPPDRIPVQDPQTPESTTPAPDRSNSSKNGISLMKSTQGTMTDTTDSTSAVTGNSGLSSETNTPVKQDGNKAETCNKPSSSEPFSESSAKTSGNTNPPDRIPVQDPQTPESTTPAPDKSNSSKNGKSLMSPTQGTMTDTTDSTSAVTGNSVLSSETNAPVKQYGNKAETCNRPSSSEPFSESSAKTSGNESTALLITQETQESVNSQLEGIQAQDETPLLTEVNVYDKEEVKRDNDTDRERKIEKVDEMKVSKSVNVDSTLVPNKESTVAFNQLKSKDGKGESLANTSTFTEQESIMGRLRLGRDGAANYIDVPQKLFHPRKLMTDIGLSLEMVDDKLKEIILSRSGLEGQVDCIERRINFLEHKLRELEKDCNILNRKTISEERGNLDRCVKWLDKKLSYLFQRTEEVEINLRTGIMPGEDDQHCDNDLNCRSIETESVVIDVVKKLEGGIKKLEERLMSLYETRSGEKGRTDMLTYIIKHQEIEVLNLEKESGIDLNLTSDFDSVSQNMRQLPSMEKFSKTLNTRLDFLKNNM